MLRYDIYDQKKFNRMCLFLVGVKNPELSPEELIKKSNSQAILQDVAKQFLTADLAKYYFDDLQGRQTMKYCDQKAKNLIDRSPKELLVNIQEWLSNQPISDIKINNVSINDILQEFKNARPLHFLQVVECFCAWKENDYYDDRFWFTYFTLP